jgi:hypothetical protein
MTTHIDEFRHPVVADELCGEMREYNALTKELGIKNPQARLEELKAFLSENCITVYPLDKVDLYLQEKAKAAGPQVAWCWKPVRVIDRRLNIRGFRSGAALQALIRQQTEMSRIMTFRGDPLMFEVDMASGEVQIAPRPIPQPVWHGLFSESVYPHAIPVVPLMAMKIIQDAFPEAQFFASDYEVQNPDPFLAVMLPDTPDLFVIERWDEPGFRM